MSTINLETSEDIKIFLKLLAEESIKDAKSSIHADSKQSSVIDRMKSDSKIFNNIHEQDNEEVEVEEAEEVEKPVEDSSDAGADLEVSLDSISDAVKDLRSGRSVDDSSMKSQLRTYFDRLDALERAALLTFMKAFAGILTGQTDGSSAPDPSDPPDSITMSSDDEEVSVDVEEEEPALSDDQDEEEPEEGEEDTAPPIKAGSPADLSEIRKRVRNLMRS